MGYKAAAGELKNDLLIIAVGTCCLIGARH